MNGSDLAISADILEELKIRWPGVINGVSDADKSNMRSFLAFRLRQAQIKNVDNFITFVTQTKTEANQKGG